MFLEDGEGEVIIYHDTCIVVVLNTSCFIFLFGCPEKEKEVWDGYSKFSRTREINVWANLLQVTDAAGIGIPSQTSPVFQELSHVIADSHYDITFMADVPPLGLTTYFLHAVLPAQNV
jgi:hypothetical protein